jgi:hypothetical protein
VQVVALFTTVGVTDGVPEVSADEMAAPVTSVVATRVTTPNNLKPSRMGVPFERQTLAAHRDREQ